MSFVSRRIGFIITLIALWAAAQSAIRADLIWDQKNGWRVEGGVLAQYADSSEGHSAKAVMDEARRAEEVGSKGAALSEYKKVIKKFSSSVFAPEALYRSARIYESRRQFGKAQKNLQRIIDEHPAYEHFIEVLSSQYAIAQKLADGVRPLYWGLIPGFRQRAKGLEYFEQVVVNAPYSEYAPLALMKAAKGYTESDDRDAAIDALDRMINNYPNSFLTADAYLKLAGAQASITQGPPYDQASTQLALTYFQDYIILYPGEADASIASKGYNDARVMLAESKMNMANFYYKYRSNYKAAKVFFNEAITLYPESLTADRARKYLAKIDKIESGEMRDENAPRSGPRAKRFWLF